MSGSRDSLAYRLGRLLSEVEERAEGGSASSSGSGASSRAGSSARSSSERPTVGPGGDLGRGFGKGGDRPVPRWSRYLLVLAGLVAAVGLTGMLPVSGLASVGIALVLGALALFIDSIEIVQAYEQRALTVFGANQGLLDPGLHFVPPLISRTYQFDMRTETLDVPKQEAITRDNSPVTADAVVYVRVVDAERAFLQVDDYRRATSYLAQTTLRAAIGDMDLDETLSRREDINRFIREELQEPTDRWGIEVEAVEVREVMPSRDVVNAMEQQSSAERHRRAMILEAQGERVSAVETAEGEKTSNIIRAQGEKQSQILEAQGDAISTVLRAKSAESMGERAIIDKGFDTLSAIGRSPSTTFVLPQELTSLLGRHGKHLSGTDHGVPATLDSNGFDDETREILGLDDIADIAAGVESDVEMTSIEIEEAVDEAVEGGPEAESN
jgi:regulator of protease activity HflC (stomatin/prohibitin superfamily)